MSVRAQCVSLCVPAHNDMDYYTFIGVLKNDKPLIYLNQIGLFICFCFLFSVILFSLCLKMHMMLYYIRFYSC